VQWTNGAAVSRLWRAIGWLITVGGREHGDAIMMFLRTLVFAAVISIPLFAGAGEWVFAFIVYVVMVWLVSGTIYTLLQWKSPALVAERFKPPADRDRASRRIAIPLMLLHYLIAGLDIGRFGWSTVPPAAQVVGFATTGGALALVGWTLLSNPFASTAVRVQAERGHTVISTGPYAFVRHPMYLAVLLFCLGSGPALGSWWSTVALFPVLIVFVRRTLFEDRMLCDELPGYREYALRVPYRVVPGIF
jgi:protein-S-isoprenylcysteine O-methyltransferase Ste14